MRLPLPREHGAWVMTVLALVAGTTVGPYPITGSTAIAWVAVLAAFLAQSAWLDGAAPRWLWIAELGTSLGLFLDLLTRGNVRFAPVCALAGALAGLAQWLRRNERRGARVRIAAFGAHLAGAFALAGAAAIVAATRPISVRELVWLWGVLALGFGSGVTFVQAVMQGKLRSVAPLLVLNLLAVMTIGTCAILNLEPVRTFLCLLPAFVRLALVPEFRRRGISWRSAGLFESLACLWTVVAMPGVIR